MRELSGRVALVTGASRGIGAAIARGLAAAGARVIATDLQAPEAIAAEIGGLALPLDVTDETDWIEAVAFARRKAGGLDILVNNAGVFFMKPLEETSFEDWRRVHAVNLDGVFLGCKYAIPLLAERAPRWAGGGAIVNISSAAGLVGGANFGSYCSSKGGVRLLTKSLAIELAPRKIRVNSVHPGLIETEMGRQVIADVARMAESNDAEALLIAAHPLGRAGQPENVADGVVFLASDKAAYTTGSELLIDGGLTAQ